MNFLDKLDYLMERDRLNKHTLAQRSGVPYTTIDAFYKKGYANVKLSTLEKLCAFFSVPLDYLALDQYEKPEDFTPSGNAVPVICETPEETDLLGMYRSLNQTGREMLMSTARAFAGNPDMLKEEQSASAM